MHKSDQNTADMFRKHTKSWKPLSAEYCLPMAAALVALLLASLTHYT